jgi:hypothetical protein
MRLDESTIYQIFAMAHRRATKSEIASYLSITRDTVDSHLSGRFRWRYSLPLQRRIKNLQPPQPRKRPIPFGFISIAEASYFFERRPTVKSMLGHYRDLRTEMIGGANFTRHQWAQECAEKRNVANLQGVCMTREAARYMYGVKTDRFVIQLSDFDSSDTPAGLIHGALGIMAWTGQPFVTLDVNDVIRLAS